jgi:hypothetical protein
MSFQENDSSFVFYMLFNTVLFFTDTFIIIGEEIQINLNSDAL